MKNWFDLTTLEKLENVHSMNLFPKKRNKNNVEFLTMMIEFLISKVQVMTKEEENVFFDTIKDNVNYLNKKNKNNGTIITEKIIDNWPNLKKNFVNYLNKNIKE